MHGLHSKSGLPLIAAAALFCVAFAGWCGHEASAATNASTNQAIAEATPPALAQQGQLIFDHTPKYAKKYVGNTLTCNDCHLESGTQAFSAPMIDLAGLFPMYSKRAGHVITLTNRIQECFVRSEAGTPPPANSKTMRALVAYIDWLSRSGVKGKPYQGRGLVPLPALTGDPVAGKAIYGAQCAMCHGVNGAGVPHVFPALWGNNSYNTGAGMNNPSKMARFVVHNMPQTHPGLLSPQQAYDVAAYIHTKPRPKFNPVYKSY